MPKKLSIFIVSDNGSFLGRVTASGKILFLLAMVFIIAASGIGFLVFDYVHLKKALFERAALDRKVAVQSDEIYNQRRQIQSFALKINDLKSKFYELEELERKIRVIANLENDEVEEGVFGVGGPIPEDLEPELELKRNHRRLIRKMHDHTEKIETAALSKKFDLQSLIDSLEKKVAAMASTPAIRPTNGWVASTFGYRKSPFTGLRHFHKGLDIAAKKGTPVKATADGKVTFSGIKGAFGKTIVIDHGGGLRTQYGHLNKILKKRGETVKRGEIIAQVGSTGRSTGSHLHYEVHLNGVPVNPQKYILN